jgi:hypothetical protein
MIGMKNKASNMDFKENIIELMGFCMLKFCNEGKTHDYDIIYKKGFDVPLIQNIMELCKNEITQKTKGNSTIPLDDYIIIIHFYEDKNQNKIVNIFMDDKESEVNYTKLYLVSRKIFNQYNANMDAEQIKESCNEYLEIPRSEGLLGIFILNPSGSPYFSKIDKKRANLAKKDVQISGFISALLTFSKEIIGKESGGNLKEIVFGNQRFYVIIKKNIIFAYLVEKVNQLLKRYMYLIVDEFFSNYDNELKNFNGDISPFEDFEDILNQYFKL